MNQTKDIIIKLNDQYLQNMYGMTTLLSFDLTSVSLATVCFQLQGRLRQINNKKACIICDL